MSKFLVETHYTCTFKIVHELDELNEKSLSEVDNRKDGKVEIVNVTVNNRKTKRSDGKKEIKSDLKVYDIRRYKFEKKFDLIISINCLHNLEIFELTKVIQKIVKYSKKSYVAIEGYKNIHELFNLQCWALTANTFFSKKEWLWFFKKNNYKGEFEIIYFN